MYNAHMAEIITIREYKGVNLSLRWIPDFKVTEVSGIIFDQEGKVLITRSSSTSSWGIPGGHPEAGEEVEQTLARAILPGKNVR